MQRNRLLAITLLVIATHCCAQSPALPAVDGPVEVPAQEWPLRPGMLISADLLRMSGETGRQKIRHDQTVVGAIVLELAQQGQRAKLKLSS